jgi:hypothetical protein
VTKSVETTTLIEYARTQGQLTVRKISLVVVSTLLITTTLFFFKYHQTIDNAIIKSIENHLVQLLQINDHSEIERQLGSILSKTNIVHIAIIDNTDNEAIIVKASSTEAAYNSNT